jgi:hypothetical protein
VGSTRVEFTLDWMLEIPLFDNLIRDRILRSPFFKTFDLLMNTTDFLLGSTLHTNI